MCSSRSPPGPCPASRCAIAAKLLTLPRQVHQSQCLRHCKSSGGGLTFQRTAGGPIPAVFAEDSALSRALGELRRATRQKAALIVSDLNEHAMRIPAAVKLYYRRRHTCLREWHCYSACPAERRHHPSQRQLSMSQGARDKQQTHRCHLSPYAEPAEHCDVANR